MKKIYGLDLRSIAGFRIILAAFIALEFGLMVLGNFRDIYSPETGILGNDFAKEYLSYYKGFHGVFFIDSDSGMKLFIWLIILTMLLLAIGFYPRLMALTGCVLMYLFFNRYSLLYFGWEMYASVMLFWLIFVPATSCFTFFKRKGEEPVVHYEWRSPLAFALLFQIGFIYFYNGISKNGDLWMAGKALDSFLAETDKINSFGTWFRSQNFSGISSFLTYLTLLIEIILLFILFTPWKNKKLRYFAAISILVLHWTIALFADVGNFKYVATAAAVALLPGDFWDGIAHFLSKAKVGFDTRKQIQLPVLKLSLLNISEKYIAGLLCFIILFSNLSQTNASMTADRMKQVIDATHLNGVLKTINHGFLPRYSFFTQYWHLYSPDPPNEKGYMRVEVITTGNDTISVYNGKPFLDNRFHSRIQHYFFNVLLLKKGRNQKEKIAEKCLQMREISLWNKFRGNPKIRSLQLVIYSRHFNRADKIQRGYNRVEYKSIDIKYR